MVEAWPPRGKVRRESSCFSTGWTFTVLVPPFISCYLRRYMGTQTSRKKGLKRLAEAAELVERTEERRAAAEMRRLQAKLLLAAGAHTAAEDG